MSGDSGNYVAKVYRDEIKQLDKKYIPTTSWNDLTDKPFYMEDIRGTEILPNSEFEKLGGSSCA